MMSKHTTNTPRDWAFETGCFLHRSEWNDINTIPLYILFQPTTAHVAFDGTKRRTPTLDHGPDTHPETDPYLQLSLHEQLSPLHTGRSWPS